MRSSAVTDGAVVSRGRVASGEQIVPFYTPKIQPAVHLAAKLRSGRPSAMESLSRPRRPAWVGWFVSATAACVLAVGLHRPKPPVAPPAEPAAVTKDAAPSHASGSATIGASALQRADAIAPDPSARAPRPALPAATILGDALTLPALGDAATIDHTTRSHEASESILHDRR
jgi:hypothetical protein